jgi:hypothetical protein
MSASALDQQTAAQAENSRMIESIIVISERTMHSLRIQLREMKTQLFYSFNDLNTDDEFDFDCRLSNNVRTKIQKHTCVPEFLDQAIAQNTQDAFNFYQLGPPPVDFLKSIEQLIRENEDNFEKLRATMLEIAEANEEFGKELLAFGRSQQEFDYRQQECMKKPAVLFLFRKC